MAVVQCKQLKNNQRSFASDNSHFLLTRIPLFFLNAFASLFVMPCVPRTFHSFVPQSLHSLHNLYLHGIRPAGNVLRGESGGRPVPVVRARLVPRQLPPQPPYAGSGSRSTHLDQRCSDVHLTLTVCCLTLKRKIIDLVTTLICLESKTCAKTAA